MVVVPARTSRTRRAMALSSSSSPASRVSRSRSPAWIRRSIRRTHVTGMKILRGCRRSLDAAPGERPHQWVLPVRKGGISHTLLLGFPRNASESGHEVIQVTSSSEQVTAIPMGPMMAAPHRSEAGGLTGSHRVSRRVSVVLGALLVMMGAATAPAMAIENGTPVLGPNPYPYVGLLLVPYPGGTYICTSTLVAPTWVLTADHCLKDHSYEPSYGPITVKLNMAATGDPNAVVRQTTTGYRAGGFDLALL